MRTGHPRAVSPVIVGVVGLVLLVIGLVLAGRNLSGATGSAGPQVPPIPVTIAEPAVCPTTFHTVWTDHLPGPAATDAQKLPASIRDLPAFGGTLTLSLAYIDIEHKPTALSDAIGSALADWDGGSYYTPSRPGEPAMVLAIGTPKAGNCAERLVLAALGGDSKGGGAVNTTMLDAGPNLARFHAKLACGGNGYEPGYTACAWASTTVQPALVGEMGMFLPLGHPLTAAQAVSVTDRVFGDLVNH